MAGGSVTNTIRGLAAGFGVSCGLVDCYGDDEQGHLFVTNMRFNGADVSRLRQREGATGRCVFLVDASSPGRRTMRPCLSKAVTFQADELTREFKGSKWLLVRFRVFNIGVMETAIRIAKQEGISISMDLASFETVRECRQPIVELLESGDIDLCFADEDEARKLVGGSIDDGDDHQIPGTALAFLGEKCKWAVVTLGAKGCIAKHEEETVRVAATNWRWEGNNGCKLVLGTCLLGGSCMGWSRNCPWKIVANLDPVVVGLLFELLVVRSSRKIGNGWISRWRSRTSVFLLVLLLVIVVV